jgi:hypothetical protein
VRRCMSCDNGWSASAKEYLAMYDDSLNLW